MVLCLNIFPWNTIHIAGTSTHVEPYCIWWCCKYTCMMWHYGVYFTKYVYLWFSNVCRFILNLLTFTKRVKSINSIYIYLFHYSLMGGGGGSVDDNCLLYMYMYVTAHRYAALSSDHRKFLSRTRQVQTFNGLSERPNPLLKLMA